METKIKCPDCGRCIGFINSTDKLNNLFNSDKMKEYKELENKKDIPALNKEIEEDDDEEIEFLEKLLAQRKAKKKE